MTFKEAEEKFKKYRKLFEDGLISYDDFKSRVKELVVRDRQGNVWMMGLKSGKWFRKTPEGWVPDLPPKEETVPLEKIFTGEEEDAGEEEKITSSSEELQGVEKEYILKGISPFSFALFLGGLGILAGVVVGAFAEALVPSFLASIGLSLPGVGTLWKAFIYSILTGLASFVVFFVLGYIFTLIFNLVLEVFGGIRIYLS